MGSSHNIYKHLSIDPKLNLFSSLVRHNHITEEKSRVNNQTGELKGTDEGLLKFYCKSTMAKSKICIYGCEGYNVAHKFIRQLKQWIHTLGQTQKDN